MARVGRWELGNAIGGGGQGQVYRVEDTEGEHPEDCALKHLKDARRTARFEVEIQQTKSLHAEGARVLPVLDDSTQSGEWKDKPWYVTPLADGGNLGTWIEQNVDDTSLEARLEMALEVVRGVESLHEQTVAHRDLKPSNILIHEGEILLCDLGLCLPLEEFESGDRLTDTLEQIGSRHYMPPEAFSREPATWTQSAFDAYALGKILYELIEGHVLPGFESVYDEGNGLGDEVPGSVLPELTFIINRLTHQEAEPRLEALSSLGEDLRDILDRLRGEELPPEEGPNFAVARDALERLKEKRGASERVEDVKAFLEQAAGAVTSSWETSSRLRSLKEELIDPHSDSVRLTVSDGNWDFRSVLRGAYVKTHRGLEPIWQEGFPKAPEFDSSSALVIEPTGEDLPLPAIYGAVIIGTSGDQMVIASGVVLQSPEDGYVDFETDTVEVEAGDVLTAEMLQSARSHAERVLDLTIRRMVDSVAQAGGS